MSRRGGGTETRMTKETDLTGRGVMTYSLVSGKVYDGGRTMKRFCKISLPY